MCDLNDHIASCDSCRAFLEEVARASVQFLPVLAEEKVVPTNAATPAGMRGRFLSRLAKEVDGSCPPAKGREDARWQFVSAQAMGELPSHSGRPEISFLTDQKRSPGRVVSPPAGNPLRHGLGQPAEVGFWRVAAAIAATVVIGATGFYLGRRTVATKPGNAAPPAVLRSAHSEQIPSSPQSFRRLTDLERERAELQHQLTVLSRQLFSAKTEQDSLRSALADAQARLAALQQVNSAGQQAPPKPLETKNQWAALESESERLRQSLADSEARLSAQQHITDQVYDRLQMTEANLQQELSLKDAKRQMGELVAARNLHIVDVYDADPNGKRQRAFGRVFYEEGKSLVFYAYDLDDPGRRRANVVFHVWGGKAGVKEVTHSLGILQKDEGGESCWAMTFDDPKVLTEINSVFVTAESANKHYDEPHGKKVLYAYFGSPPNHP
jgi:hypothetical protein